MVRVTLPGFLHLPENSIVFVASAINRGRPCPGLHARSRSLRVLQGVSGLEARDALSISQRRRSGLESSPESSCIYCRDARDGQVLKSFNEMTLKLDGLWRLCTKYRASLGWTPGPFSVSACFTGRLWAGGKRRLVNIAETAIGLRVQGRVALYSRFQTHVDS